MNPGMVLRAHQEALEPMKNIIKRRMITDYSLYMEVPDHYRMDYRALWGIIDYEYEWYDIDPMPIVMDVDSFKFELARDALDHRTIVKFKMPLIEFWQVTAYQKYNSWFFPSTSEVALTFVDFEFEFEGSLLLNEKGYLDPLVENCSIHFGQSTFTHENDIMELFYHQLVVFSIVVIENTSFYMGKYIFS